MNQKLGLEGSDWIQGKWPQNWASLNITILEIYPVLILASLFENKIKNSKIIYHCDNEAVVAI